MKTITIIFMGLIAHVNQPRMSLDDTAVLLRREGHTPQMKVDAAAILNREDAWVKSMCKGADPCMIDLTDYAVRLRDTRGMFCNKRPVAAAVPKLRTIAPACSGLKRAVRDRKVDSQFVAFVDYGAGELTVDSYFTETVSFRGKKGPFQCTACTVQYKGVLDGNEAIFEFEHKNGDKHALRLAGNSKVEVTNNPPHDHATRSRHDSHFLAHYLLMEGCNGPAPLVEGTCSRPDEDELCGLATVPLADCTNSQYP